MKKTSDNETNVIMQNQEKSNKCSQCRYASAHESALRGHLKIHKVEKSNVCSLCNFASFYASNFKKHMRAHTAEKSNKCNQCDFVCSQTNTTSANMHVIMKVL